MLILDKNSKVVFFDVCHTLVKTTTISSFVENFFISFKYHLDFRIIRNFFIHFIFKVFRKFNLISFETYRRHFFYLFKGYSIKKMNYIVDKYIDDLFFFIKPDILNILNDYKNKGFIIFLVSGGLDIYLEKFAKKLEVNLIATELEIKNGFLTGKIKGEDCVGKGKVDKIKSSFNEFNFKEIDSVSFGNEFSDIFFMSLTQKSISIDPDIKLEDFSLKNNWEIIKT